MSSPIATPPPPPTTTSPLSDRLKAVKQFDETKAGVKGLIDSGIKTIPSIFIHPPETLSDLVPGSEPEPEIPTIDLSHLHSSRAAVVDQIHHAASTVGFFQ
ncbi:1-aminocyclopropane-1-carboxylate oxidase-like protein, partial [Trifolium medium]|nr:1-aminocyclopropane-1-carboxylate oxidase-like protein [Trifolium medium]